MTQPQKKILIIEDDTALRAFLVEIFQKDNKLQVLEAGDGQEAYDKVVKEQPDILLLDLLLPTMDGFKVLAKVREEGDQKVANVPVVVLSNLFSNEALLRTQALKVEGYYVKAQTKLEDVVSKVHEILGL